MEYRSASHLHRGKPNEDDVAQASASARERLGAEPTFGLVFFSPEYADDLEDFLETLRLHAHIPVLVGCSGAGLIADGEEAEGLAGFSLLLVHAPGCRAIPVEVPLALVEDEPDADALLALSELQPSAVAAWLMFADPFSCPAESLLTVWNKAYPDVPVFGGLAGGPPGVGRSWIVVNGGESAGAVALALCGDIELTAVVSQGCEPIGEPMTVTRAHQNLVLTLGSEPALEVLREAYQNLDSKRRETARGHLFAGLAMSEYVDNFKRGDFLVRNIIGTDADSGVVALNSAPRVGQTLQYHLRDAVAASAELDTMLARAQKLLAEDCGLTPFGALLCTCAGRGEALFNRANHDAGSFQRCFPELPTAGFFANGEIGPVAGMNFVHSYTASIAILCQKKV